MENEEKTVVGNVSKKTIELADKINNKSSSEEDVLELEFTATNIALNFDSSHGQEDTNPSLLNFPRVDIPSLNQAEIRAQVAEAKTEIIAKFAAEAKTLEHQMNLIMRQIYAQNPEMKPWLLKMNKLLSEHSDIKRILSVDRVQPLPES